MGASNTTRSRHHKTVYVIGNLLTPGRIPSGHRNPVKSRKSNHSIAPKGGRERTLGVNDQEEQKEEENVNDDAETDVETLRYQ